MEKAAKSLLSSKYLVIGLDGATPEILEPMVKNGELPNIKKLMQQGAYGLIRSTLPPLSPVAWTSMTTGVNPAKHGIMGFDRRREDSYITELFNSGFRRVKPIWTILSEMGKKVGVINVPMTYPPDRINGIMITGLGTPGEKSSFTFPPELKSELVEKIGRFRIDMNKSSLKTRETHIRDLHNTLENLFNTAVYCMSKYDYDFFMVVFMTLDEASHFLWYLTDKKHPSYKKSEAEKFGNAIRDLYKALDLKVGQLIKIFGDDATVIIVSDHGFGPLRKPVSINLLFEKLGYLKFHHPSGSIFSKTNRFRLRTKAYMAKRKEELFRSLGLSKEQSPKFKASANFQFLDPIDWLGTRAYSMDDCGSIFINLKGREPLGIVEEGPPLEQLKEDIKKRLLALKDPENGQHMVKDVIFKENIYHGKCIRQVPDIFVLWEEGFGAVSDRARIRRGLSGERHNFMVRRNWSGFHTMDGVFVISGPQTKNGITLKKIQMYDVFPTILYSMGLPLPTGLDGRVIKECFSTTIQEKHSLTMDITSSTPGGASGLTEEEKDLVMEQLRSLGYLE